MSDGILDLDALAQDAKDHAATAPRERVVFVGEDWTAPPKDRDIDDRFRQAFVSYLYDLTPADRAWLRAMCDALVEDAVARLSPPTMTLAEPETVDQQYRREIGIGVRR